MLTSLLGTAIVIVSRETVSAYGQPVYAAPINLSNDASNSSSTGNATEPDVVSVGNYVYAAWSEFSNGVLFRESSDGGVTWYPPLNQSGLELAPGGRAAAPQVSANGSNVYVVWSQTVGSSGAQIEEATSINYGLNFSSAVQLTSGTGPFVTPALASWGSNIAVVYTSNNKSYVAVSSNNGSSWTTPYKYANNHENRVAIWQNYVYAIADPVTLAVSSNLGANWTVTTPSPGGSDPTIAAYGSNVFAAWETKGSSSQVYALVSNNYGANYSVNLLTNTLASSWSPVVATYGNTAWIALHTTPGGNLSKVYVYTSADNGSTWSSPASLTSTLGNSTDTSAPFDVTSSDGVNVYVSWSQQVSPNYWRLMTSYSNDSGTTWSPSPGIDISQNLNGTQASNDNAVATGATDSSGASSFAVWQYSNNSVPGVNQIYFTSYLAPVPTTSSTSSSSATTTNTNTTLSVASSVTSGMSTTIHTTSSSSSSSSSGLLSGNSGLLLDASIAAIVVIIVGVIAAIAIRRRRT